MAETRTELDVARIRKDFPVLDRVPPLGDFARVNFGCILRRAEFDLARIPKGDAAVLRRKFSTSAVRISPGITLGMPGG